MCSSSSWGVVDNLFSELREGDSTVTVLVHLVDDLVDLLVGNEVTSGLNHSLELSSIDDTVVVEIKGVEGLVGVEAWTAVDSLTEGLGGGLNSEVSSPHVLVLESGGWEEAVISSDWSWGVVRWSSLNLAGVVRIVSEESIAELGESESSVTVLVPSGNEEIDLLGSWEHVDGVEAGSELVRVDGTVSWDIEDLEGISKVEVVSVGKRDLGVLNFHLLVADVLKTVDELILIVDSEDWLSGWGSSAWRDSGWSNWGSR